MAQAKDTWQGRVVVAAAGVSAVLGLLVALLAAGYFRQRHLQSEARQERDRAAVAAQEARAAANRGNRARDEAEALVEFILDDLSAGLEEIGRSDLLLAAARQAVDYFDNLPPESVTPESLDKQATILMTLGQTYYVQGEHEPALAAMRRCIELRRRRIAASDPNGEQTFILGRELGELALVQNQSDDWESARATYQEAAALFANPPAGAERDGRWQYGLGGAIFGVGEVERLKRNYPAALAQYSNAVSQVTAALAIQPEEINWLKKLMNVHNNIGVALMYEDRFKDAEADYLLALEIGRKLIRMEPQNRRWEKEVASTLMNIGTCLDEQREFARAEPFIREALALREGLVAWDTKNTRNMRSLAHAWHNLGSLQLEIGQPAAALQSARQCLATFHRLLTIDPGSTRWILDMERSSSKFRDGLVAAGMNQEALRLMEETAAFAEANRTGREAADAWTSLLSGLYQDIGRLGGEEGSAAALETRRKGLAFQAARVDRNQADAEGWLAWAAGCLQLGLAHRDAGFPQAGLECLRITRLVLSDQVPLDSPQRRLLMDWAERADILAAAQLGQLAPPQTLVPSGADWKYWDRAETPPEEWTQPDFDDAAWQQGSAVLGYGEGDIVTPVRFGSDPHAKPVTVWFRHAFTIEDPTSITNVHFHLRRDDGAVVHLNGREVYRDGLPEGAVTAATTAAMAQNEAEYVFHARRFATTTGLPLKSGRNVVAVEVHQNEPQSSDLSMDLEIWANVTAPPLRAGLTWNSARQTLSDALPESAAALIGNEE